MKYIDIKDAPLPIDLQDEDMIDVAEETQEYGRS